MPTPGKRRHVTGAVAAFDNASRKMLYATESGLQVLDLVEPGSEPQALSLTVEPQRAAFLRPWRSGMDGAWPVVKVGETPGCFLVTASGELVALEASLDGPLHWVAGGWAGTTTDGDVAMLLPVAGRRQVLASKQALEKELGKELSHLTLAAHAPDGTLLIAAHRKFPDFMRDMTGTYVPSGDEEPKRGRNPGSAEPGPDMPTYLFRRDERGLRRLLMVSLARSIDSYLIAPAAGLERLLTLQVANDGGAGSGVPHVWLGVLEPDGRHEERDLGRGFAEGLDAPMLKLLEAGPDGRSAITWMEANTIYRINTNDPKVIEEHAKAAGMTLEKFRANAAAFIMAMYSMSSNAGVSLDQNGMLEVRFRLWQVVGTDAAAGTLTARGPVFTVGTKGPRLATLPAPVQHVAWSRQGVIAATLGSDWDRKSPKGLLLARCE
jgi:hypothetical protein